MAQFSMDFHDIENIEKIAIPECLNKDDTFLEMVEAGQEIMLDSIKKSANNHRKTGNMANSIKATKAVIDKNGDAVGRVKFVGSDGTKKLKNGQSFDLTNWIKAFRIEYGTSRQTAMPFVSPAIISAESQIRKKKKKKFEEKLKNG